MEVVAEDNSGKIQILRKWKIFNHVRTFLSSLVRWEFHSKSALEKTETLMLSCVKTSYKKFHVDIGNCVGKNDKIWTLTMNTESLNTPIVLLHGYVSALAFWMLNYDEFAAHRPVYAIDLLGFGRSSRPEFAQDPLDIEQQYVAFLEKWREKMNIPKMILLGHSLGGFISASYALKYPERVEHLILVDPWGFTGAPDLNQFNVLHRTGLKFFQRFPPFSLMRMAGPWTAPFFRLCRQDIIGRFERIYDVPQRRIVSEYVTHCNNISISGERSFHRLMKNGPWAAHPIGEKVQKNICDKIPITFVYGAKSWIDSSTGQLIKQSRPQSYTSVHMVENAGHKVFSDQDKIFNQIVNESCKVLKSNCNS